MIKIVWRCSECSQSGVIEKDYKKPEAPGSLVPWYPCGVKNKDYVVMVPKSYPPWNPYREGYEIYSAHSELSPACKNLKLDISLYISKNSKGEPVCEVRYDFIIKTLKERRF